MLAQRSLYSVRFAIINKEPLRGTLNRPPRQRANLEFLMRAATPP